MATMIDGESYLGQVLVRPLSKEGDVTIYLWPVRCLKSKMGGPTFGVDVKKGKRSSATTHTALAATGIREVTTSWAPVVFPRRIS
ncbi:MAG: hypothetical protein CM1200mP27_07750 [Chloroflexota bacterium]|nr:MAG: hypothetical protein CM1200mP27_07750 [Chloroflexota bacterium]